MQVPTSEDAVVKIYCQFNIYLILTVFNTCEYCLAHDREPNRVEIFKIGRCKELLDGNGQWVDDESRSQYERMIQLSTPLLDSESGSTPISAEEAFVSVMGKDRSGRIRCGSSWETRRTWYGTGEGSRSTDYQQQISNIENTIRMEVEELHTEAYRRDSEMDEMWTELEQLRIDAKSVISDSDSDSDPLAAL
ncbi:hypothetical protein Taro_020232, partial [Colocasia esculenta]|nr:hypothetical protein [Colocasia esculenta]